MEMYDLLKHLVATLEQLGIPYLVVGSVASIVYGEPRFTNDIDVVVELKPSQVTQFCSAFSPPDYYCSLAAAQDAVRNRFQFNILHPTSGLKIDVIIATDSEFDHSRLKRGIRQFARADFDTVFASPEDIILRKLDYFKLGGSDKHLRDIVGILKVQANTIDRVYLNDWIARLGLANEWALVEGRLGEDQL